MRAAEGKVNTSSVVVRNAVLDGTPGISSEHKSAVTYIVAEAFHEIVQHQGMFPELLNVNFEVILDNIFNSKRTRTKFLMTLSRLEIAPGPCLSTIC